MALPASDRALATRLRSLKIGSKSLRDLRERWRSPSQRVTLVESDLILHAAQLVYLTIPMLEEAQRRAALASLAVRCREPQRRLAVKSPPATLGDDCRACLLEPVQASATIQEALAVFSEGRQLAIGEYRPLWDWGYRACSTVLADPALDPEHRDQLQTIAMDRWQRLLDCRLLESAHPTDATQGDAESALKDVLEYAQKDWRTNRSHDRRTVSLDRRHDVAATAGADLFDTDLPEFRSAILQLSQDLGYSKTRQRFARLFENAASTSRSPAGRAAAELLLPGTPREIAERSAEHSPIVESYLAANSVPFHSTEALEKAFQRFRSRISSWLREEAKRGDAFAFFVAPGFGFRKQWPQGGITHVSPVVAKGAFLSIAAAGAIALYLMCPPGHKEVALDLESNRPPPEGAAKPAGTGAAPSDGNSRAESAATVATVHFPQRLIINKSDLPRLDRDSGEAAVGLSANYRIYGKHYDAHVSGTGEYYRDKPSCEEHQGSVAGACDAIPIYVPPSAPRDGDVQLHCESPKLHARADTRKLLYVELACRLINNGASWVIAYGQLAMPGGSGQTFPLEIISGSISEYTLESWSVDYNNARLVISDSALPLPIVARAVFHTGEVPPTSTEVRLVLKASALVSGVHGEPPRTLDVTVEEPVEILFKRSK